MVATLETDPSSLLQVHYPSRVEIELQLHILVIFKSELVDPKNSYVDGFHNRYRKPKCNMKRYRSEIINACSQMVQQSATSQSNRLSFHDPQHINSNNKVIKLHS